MIFAVKLKSIDRSVWHDAETLIWKQTKDDVNIKARFPLYSAVWRPIQDLIWAGCVGSTRDQAKECIGYYET